MGTLLSTRLGTRHRHPGRAPAVKVAFPHPGTMPSGRRRPPAPRPPTPSASEPDDEGDVDTDTSETAQAQGPADDDPSDMDEYGDGDEIEEEDEEEDEEDEPDEELVSDEDATTSGGGGAAGGRLITPSLEGLKEIGNLASWTVSTAKPGNGVEQLRDEDTSLFWQSDGPQPHHINIHFAKRVLVKRMRLYLDFEHDESYTPTKLSVLSGTGYHDLQEVTKLELERPAGWVEVALDGVHEE